MWLVSQFKTFPTIMHSKRFFNTTFTQKQAIVLRCMIGYYEAVDSENLNITCIVYYIIIYTHYYYDICSPRAGFHIVFGINSVK